MALVWRNLLRRPARTALTAAGDTLAGDRARHTQLKIGRRTFRVTGVYHSGDEFEDTGAVLPLRTVQRLAHRPGEVTTVAVTVRPGLSAKSVAERVERRFPGT